MKIEIDSQSQSPSSLLIDVPRLRQALLSFSGRVAKCGDPVVQNALCQLRRDLKRAKINLDN